MWEVQLFELNYDAREKRAVQEVLDSGWITMGPKTEAFEASFSTMLSGIHCTAVSSGTAALHLALLSLGIGRGDEVIVPALTFIADFNVVRMVGATPVPADSESYDLWNVDVEDIRSRITDRTKAVLAVHYGGYPCRMDELTQLCSEEELHLIEDVAHAPGGEFSGRALGTFGSVSAFSFFTNKNLSVGEGGMVCTESKEIHDRLRLLRSHGMTTLTLDRHEGRAISYDVIQPGLNYRMDEIRAALGLVQLDKLGDGNAERRRLSKEYDERLSELPWIRIPFRDYEPGVNTHHIYPILLGEFIERNELVEELRARGIQVSIHYPAIGGFSGYSMVHPEDTPVASDIARRELTLPLYPDMGSEKVDRVCEALIDGLQGMGSV